MLNFAYNDKIVCRAGYQTHNLGSSIMKLTLTIFVSLCLVPFLCFSSVHPGCWVIAIGLL